jgi:hypothetical protein
MDLALFAKVATELAIVIGITINEPASMKIDVERIDPRRIIIWRIEN